MDCDIAGSKGIAAQESDHRRLPGWLGAFQLQLDKTVALFVLVDQLIPKALSLRACYVTT